jgi:hypothetical protein
MRSTAELTTLLDGLFSARVEYQQECRLKIVAMFDDLRNRIANLETQLDHSIEQLRSIEKQWSIADIEWRQIGKDHSKALEHLRSIIAVKRKAERVGGLVEVLDAIDVADEWLNKEQRQDDIATAVSHWFTQGGKAEFGDIGDPTNADELISAILRVVREHIETKTC